MSDISVEEVLKNAGGCSNMETTKVSIAKTLSQIKRFQERIRKHIEDNYVEFMPSHTSSDLYLEESNLLVRETENVIKNVHNDSSKALEEANTELFERLEELRECELGLKVSHRILKVDDLFQCVEEANASKEYLVVLDLMSKLNTLIYTDGGSDVDRIFQKCECFEAIKVKYQVQSHILKQNLQQRFERQVKFSEKQFPQAKCVTIQVSKDLSQLQDTVMALFQARYNPVKICNFLMDNCFEPIIMKPVSIEYSEENVEYVELKLSYSVKDLITNLRPSYKQVFEHMKTVLQCLGNINVSVADDKHVFTIIGDHIKKKLLKLLVEECLMYSIPETMEEFQKSNMVENVILLEQLLADTFLINSETDRTLSEFTETFEKVFFTRLSKKILENAKKLMQRDLQDMTEIAETNTPEDVANNPFLFPRCMVSKGTLDLIKLMERILRQPTEDNSKEYDNFLNLISIILNSYVEQVPEIHNKLLENIPQQSALLYNNCMFLALWVAKNSDICLPAFPTLVKILQATGAKYLKVQISKQQDIITEILKDFDLSEINTLGTTPLKLIRQCLRQLELLSNVWQNVLPETIYNRTFCDIINDFCMDIIKRIIILEDISATVANELADLIDVILEKGPSLFKQKHDILQVRSWMKIQQLKIILKASLLEITDQWCGGSGILTANFSAEEVRHLIRALFQNTDRRANALTKIV